jgi:hypothetical protein
VPLGGRGKGVDDETKDCRKGEVSRDERGCSGFGLLILEVDLSRQLDRCVNDEPEAHLIIEERLDERLSRSGSSACFSLVGSDRIIRVHRTSTYTIS